MNLRQLQFAAKVAETGSFSAAAAACHVTQPALSNGVALLEADLGGKLFERTTRQVRLTGFGRHMLPLVRSMLTAEAELKAEARRFHHPDLKVLRIGLSPVADIRRIAGTLEPYTRQRPDVQIFYKECFLDVLSDRLDAEQLDILIRPSSVDPEPHIDRRPLYADPLFVVTSDRSSQGATTVRDLADETLILGPDGCGLVGVMRRLFSEAGLTLREYPGEALSYQVMQDWADIGIGATVVPLSKVDPSQRSRARPLVGADGQPAVIDIETWWRPDFAEAPHIAALHRHLVDVAPRLLEGAAP